MTIMAGVSLEENMTNTAAVSLEENMTNTAAVLLEENMTTLIQAVTHNHGDAAEDAIMQVSAGAPFRPTRQLSTKTAELLHQNTGPSTRVSYCITA